MSGDGVGIYVVFAGAGETTNYNKLNSNLINAFIIVFVKPLQVSLVSSVPKGH